MSAGSKAIILESGLNLAKKRLMRPMLAPTSNKVPLVGRYFKISALI